MRAFVSPTSGDVIIACVNERSGSLYLVDSEIECGKNEAVVTWNVEGPPGPTGPVGPEGPAGPEGPPGGLADHTVVLEYWKGTVEPGDDIYVIAECPAGTRVVGGGYVHNPTLDPDIVVSSNTPWPYFSTSDRDAWTAWLVAYTYIGDYPVDGLQFRSHAICAKAA